jgi:hypothetical protein
MEKHKIFEINLNYSYAGDERTIYDYMAMFGLWKRGGSGGEQFGSSPIVQIRRDKIDDMFERVTDTLYEKVIYPMVKHLLNSKELNQNKFNEIIHFYKTQKWLDFHSSIKFLLSKSHFSSFSKSDIFRCEDSPFEYLNKLSKVIFKLINSNKQLYDIYKLFPKRKIPIDIFKIYGADGRQLTEPLDNRLNKLGFEWDPENKIYYNNYKNEYLFINNTYNSILIKNDSEKIEFENLGELFKHLIVYMTENITINSKHYKQLVKTLFDSGIK